MKFYTPREVERAKKARDLLAALGTPSISDMKAAIAMNAIADLPITTKDVDLAAKDQTLEPSKARLQGESRSRWYRITSLFHRNFMSDAIQSNCAWMLCL